jgi:hypothetical protein
MTPVLVLAVTLFVTAVTGSSAKSFYDLSATDIEGNVVKFDAFRGKVSTLESPGISVLI